jgi:hypothetical protein
MADWLSTWKHRVKRDVHYLRVDSTLTNAQLPVVISADCGLDHADLSCIFDELGSDANRDKIAITTSDGTTQCYVEEKSWSDATELSFLWVRLPSVGGFAGGVDTSIYIYYDSAQAANTTYVGDPGSAVSQTVWAGTAVTVLHLGESGNGTANEYKDSTAKAHHGTGDAGAACPTQVAMIFGNGQYMNGYSGAGGGDQRLTIPDTSDHTIDTTGALCYSLLYNPTVTNWYPAATIVNTGTAVCSILIYSSGTLVDPSTSVKVSIWNENNTIVVNEQAMTNDAVGTYHYNYTTSTTGIRGQYRVIYTATDGTLITKQKDYFQLE